MKNVIWRESNPIWCPSKCGEVAKYVLFKVKFNFKETKTSLKSTINFTANFEFWKWRLSEACRKQLFKLWFNLQVNFQTSFCLVFLRTQKNTKVSNSSYILSHDVTKKWWKITKKKEKTRKSLIRGWNRAKI